MSNTIIKEWKKAALSDLDHICLELDDKLSKPCLIIVEGEVGAGKTTFIKSFIPSDDTSSPSYSLINESGMFLHADLYRLKEASELAHLELDLYIEDKTYFIVEWGKKYLSAIKKFIPEEFSIYELEIEIQKDHINYYRNFTLKQL